MTEIFQMLASNILVPTILFFVLGLIAAFVKSDLSIPDGAAKFMSLYLLLAIGFKGGHNLGMHGITADVFAAIAAGVLLSFALPFVAYLLVRGMTRLGPTDGAAVAGHYGSISIVTFVAASSLLELRGIDASGYMVAVAAAMEIPAILSALWIVSRYGQTGNNAKLPMHKLLANGSVVLLAGAFVIGVLTQDKGMEMIAPFVVTPFTGILCLFLLDMGLNAGRNLLENRKVLNIGLFGFGVTMPLVSAAIALAIGWMIGMAAGNLFLLMVLSASASYIAVPAAMRIALPQANSGVYLTLSLGVTFPFNITIGLPLYLWLASVIAG
ncbi:MAG: sodium-dependent bicarbonate transport family permease [Rhodobacteraceae bacterium]|nr:sodium-dependent bicarbonate transport family permease [Paracoccaceae bacterium]